jgi:hypothetical protein
LIRVWGRNRGNRKKERIKIYDVSEGKRRFPEYTLIIAQEIQLVKLNIFV